MTKMIEAEPWMFDIQEEIALLAKYDHSPRYIHLNESLSPVLQEETFGTLFGVPVKVFKDAENPYLRWRIEWEETK